MSLDLVLFEVCGCRGERCSLTVVFRHDPEPVLSISTLELCLAS